MAGPRPEERDDPSPEGRRAVPTLEWIIGGCGAVLVALIVGYLVFAALGRDETPPDVRLRVLEIRPLGESFVVRFEARNDGSLAAASLVVEGELELPGGETQTGEATIDYLPPRSSREAALVFPSDPTQGTLTLTPIGFAQP
ncbi:MAG: hypothetical protein R3349_11080 [Geminicoccaceae bacterium]|nr:hypothetical protein [Geminicoccaceae bacterium]